jgi:hypothetical protein
MQMAEKSEGFSGVRPLGDRNNKGAPEKGQEVIVESVSACVGIGGGRFCLRGFRELHVGLQINGRLNGRRLDRLVAQLCEEFGFVVHRLRRVALAAETCRKCPMWVADGLTGGVAPLSRSIILRSRGISSVRERPPNNAEPPTINANPNF